MPKIESHTTPAQIIQASIVEQKGNDNPSRIARNIVHALTKAGFTIVGQACGDADMEAAHDG